MAALLTAKVMNTALVFIAKDYYWFSKWVWGLYAVADVYVHSETINDCIKNFASYNCVFLLV